VLIFGSFCEESSLAELGGLVLPRSGQRNLIATLAPHGGIVFGSPTLDVSEKLLMPFLLLLVPFLLLFIVFLISGRIIVQR
jgi:hypothetical protein